MKIVKIEMPRAVLLFAVALVSTSAAAQSTKETYARVDASMWQQSGTNVVLPSPGTGTTRHWKFHNMCGISGNCGKLESVSSPGLCITQGSGSTVNLTTCGSPVPTTQQWSTQKIGVDSSGHGLYIFFSISSGYSRCLYEQTTFAFGQNLISNTLCSSSDQQAHWTVFNRTSSTWETSTAPWLQ